VSAFGPVDALRAIRAVNEDKGLGHAQRSVIVQVIVRADSETGLAWAGYRSIRKATGCAPSTIRAALDYAEGRYLRVHAVGAKGSVQYAVALQSVKRSGDTSATVSEAPALQSAKSCATVTVEKLTLLSCPTTDPKRGGAPRSSKRDPRVRQFLTWFAGEFKARVGREYVVTWPKESAIVKKLLGQIDATGDGGDSAVAELQRAAGNMLADPWGRDKGDVGLLSSKLNSWLGPREKGIDYQDDAQALANGLKIAAEDRRKEIYA